MPTHFRATRKVFKLYSLITFSTQIWLFVAIRYHIQVWREWQQRNFIVTILPFTENAAQEAILDPGISTSGTDATYILPSHGPHNINNARANRHNSARPFQRRYQNNEALRRLNSMFPELQNLDFVHRQQLENEAMQWQISDTVLYQSLFGGDSDQQLANHTNINDRQPLPGPSTRMVGNNINLRETSSEDPETMSDDSKNKVFVVVVKESGASNVGCTSCRNNNLGRLNTTSTTTSSSTDYCTSSSTSTDSTGDRCGSNATNANQTKVTKLAVVDNKNKGKGPD